MCGRTFIPFISTCFLLLLLPEVLLAQLQINEIMAINESTYTDNAGDEDAWIELYNAGSEPVLVAGLYVSNKKKNRTVFQIPVGSEENQVIEPGGYLLLWADGEGDGDGPLHLPFKLDPDGQYFSITARDGKTLIDSVTFYKQFVDVSWARYPDGGKHWRFCHAPTPVATNTTQQLNGKACATPEFSEKNGFYPNAISLELSAPAGQRVVYTTDGSIPYAGTAIEYSGPVNLEKTTVIRAMAVADNMVRSKVVTRTFFIGEKSSLPVLSLTVHPQHLWDSTTGIYTKFKLRTEVPAHAEYFENEQLAFDLDLSTRIAGKTSRRAAKRSFSLFAHKGYSESYMNYPIFKDKPINSFKSITVRSDATSGRNVSVLWVGERFKNEFMYQVNQDMGSTVSMQAYQPALLFLNGEFWGLYNLMERKGGQFLWDNYGIKDSDVITGEYAEAVDGEGESYNRVLDFADLYELRHEANYEYVARNMDMLNYIDYFFYEVYQCTGDYRVNMRYYKPRDAHSKWRWIAYDMDSWHQFSENALARYTSDGDVFLFAMLTKNQDFRNLYANRSADYLNTVLQPENAHRLIDEIMEVIDLEVDRERERWQDELPFVTRGSRVSWIKDFTQYRPHYFRQHVIKEFSLPGEASVYLNTKGPGSINISTISVDAFPWEGTYFQGIPLKLEAIPAPGFEFVGWEEPDLPQTPTIEVMPGPANRFVAIFRPSDRANK